MVVAKLNLWKEPRRLVRGKECSSAYLHNHSGDRLMARRNRVALLTAATIATIIVLAFCLLSIWNPSGLRDASSLSWGVNEGDEFVYLVVIRGHRGSIDPEGGPHILEPPFLAPMNNTRVRFNLTSLPALPLVINGDIFAEEVLNYPKTECRFENGSEIPSIFRDYINRLLCQCPLPVGDWPLLDSLYPNETEMVYHYPGVYLSRTYADSFYIGYLVYPFDDIIRWGGNVTLTTGIPIVAVSKYYSADTYRNDKLVLVT